MVKTWLRCRKCKKKTEHIVFTDKFNLPENHYLCQCYECEVMGVEMVNVELIKELS